MANGTNQLTFCQRAVEQDFVRGPHWDDTESLGRNNGERLVPLPQARHYAVRRVDLPKS